MKKEYVSPQCQQIWLSPAQSLALIEGNLELDGGRGEHTIISGNDIDIEIEE